MASGQPKSPLKNRIDLCRFSVKTPLLSIKVCSAAVNGIEAYPVEVKVNAGYGETIVVTYVSSTTTALSRPGTVRSPGIFLVLLCRSLAPFLPA
jgi:hypothetical protein